MSGPSETTPDLRRRAKALNEARDYPALDRLLRGLEEDVLRGNLDLAFLRADVGRRLGRREDALALLDRLETLFERQGNVRLQRQRLNLLGSLLFETGEILGATEAWTRQLELASTADDEEFAARANNNLGVAATVQDDLPGALSAYGRAVLSYQRLGYLRGLGQSHHNLGITYREMGFHEEADRHFRRAAEMARDGGSEDELARVEQERALLLYLMGDPRLAEHTACRALERYEALEDPAGQGEAHHVLGLVALGERDLAAGQASLDRALQLASAASAVLLRAEALEARAALRRLQERDSEADHDEESAARIFQEMSAPAWGRRIRDRARALAAHASRSGP